MVAGLLFLAFAYFAFGQAVVNRNDAQGAADAAALAAATEAREQIGEDLLDDIEEREEWDDLLDALLFPTGPSCDAASSFASKNRADSESCARTSLPRKGFTVSVKTKAPVGSSLVPGTDSKHSTGRATAVLEPLCTLKSDDEDLIELTCKGEDVTVDPDDDEPLPDLDTMFTVRLVD